MRETAAKRVPRYQQRGTKREGEEFTSRIRMVVSLWKKVETPRRQGGNLKAVTLVKSRRRRRGEMSGEKREERANRDWGATCIPAVAAARRQWVPAYLAVLALACFAEACCLACRPTLPYLLSLPHDRRASALIVGRPRS